MLTFTRPIPSHVSQRPPGVFVEKWRLDRPARRASSVPANRSRIASNTPTMVAGMLDVPPAMLVPVGGDDARERLARATTRPARRTAAAAVRGAGATTSNSSVDLPLPETPVTATSPPAGISTLRSRRLCRRACATLMPGRSSAAARCRAARPQCRRRYRPVDRCLAGGDRLGRARRDDRARPRRRRQAPGRSRDRPHGSTSSSCSTTTTVFPASRRLRSNPSSLAVSRGWSPAVGSSST